MRHSFLLKDGVFTVLDFPGATATFLQDLNDQGEIVGAYNGVASTHCKGIIPASLLNHTPAVIGIELSHRSCRLGSGVSQIFRER